MKLRTTCRLSLVFASDAPVAVVLRRGPTNWVEVVKWDTAKNYGADRDFRATEKSKEADWIGKDHKGRRILTRAGALYYVDKNHREVMLRDFNSDERREVITPRWAQNW
jgi:hypothetical protein